MSFSTKAAAQRLCKPQHGPCYKCVQTDDVTACATCEQDTTHTKTMKGLVGVKWALCELDALKNTQFWRSGKDTLGNEEADRKATIGASWQRASMRRLDIIKRCGKTREERNFWDAHGDNTNMQLLNRTPTQHPDLLQFLVGLAVRRLSFDKNVNHRADTCLERG